MNTPPGVSRKRAFSLVETAMAIGIVAFTMTALAGLMPVALASIGDARNQIVLSEITAAHLSQAARADYSTLGTLAGTHWYDYAGVSVAAGAPAAYYQVVTRLVPVDAESARFRVAVYRAPAKAEDRALDETVALVANNGR